MKNYKLLIVEDDNFTRQTLVYEFKKIESVTLLGYSENGEKAVQFVKENKPDVILMDIDMPVMNGIEATKEIKKIKKIYPEIMVVILTAHSEKEKVLSAFSSGANAYCVKNVKTDELFKVIEIVNDGGIWFDTQIAKFVFEVLNNYRDKDIKNQIKDKFNISEHEIEIIKLISEGLSNIEIAEKLFISKNTVRNHISSIMEKLSIKDRTRIAVFALENNLLK